jgi:hypothetical protein
MRKWMVLFLFQLLAMTSIKAQLDTLQTKSGDALIGEIILMEVSVLTFSTEYSDSDFKIEWDQIAAISAPRYYLISLSNGDLYNGRLQTDKHRPRLTYIYTSGDTIFTRLEDIVFIRAVDDEGILSRLNASIDFGFDLAKANNLKQSSFRSKVDYLSDFWQFSGSFNTVDSQQDSIAAIRRQEGALTAQLFLGSDWFIVGSGNYLSNTEQQLDYRLSGNAGMGKHLFRSNAYYVSVSTGLTINNEKYQMQSLSSTLEGFFWSEANIYDIGDVNILGRLILYPGITERGRLRSDFTFDLKYDLPYDFYVRLGYTYNYDSRPSTSASKDDYVLQTTLGWEW